jgi:5,10-methylenetetrahydromethanopterin reductase
VKFSLRLNNELPVSTYVEVAKLAESLGFDQLWVSDDLFLRSAPVILAAVATATERIEIGTCIVNPYTLHPAEMAMMAATLDEVSGGRFNLGISSGAGEFLQWVGIDADKPRTIVVEAVEVIRRLLAGERVAFDGKVFQWTNDAYMRFKPERQTPVYIGAMSPKMLKTIGSNADGGLPLLFPPEHYATVMPLIREGAEEAGRDIEALDIAACVWVSIAQDASHAVDPLQEKIAYFGYAMSPMILENLGLSREDFVEIEQAVIVERNIEKAKKLVTDDMLRIGIAGTPEMIIERLEKLVLMGVRHMSFGPPLGSDILEAVRLLGTKVLPYFGRNGVAIR